MFDPELLPPETMMQIEAAMRNKPSYREELNAKLHANRERAALRRMVLLFVASLAMFVLLLWMMGTAFCAELSPSTCKVIEFDRNGKLLGYGSGVLVAKANDRGYVLTAEHIIDYRPPSQFIAVFPRSTARTIYRVLDWRKQPYIGTTPPDPDWKPIDICLLQIDPPADIRPRPIRWQPLETGERVWQSGFGNSERGPREWWSNVLPFETSEGRWTSPSLLMLSKPSVQGDSGGPIIDRHGRVAGICTATDKHRGYHVTLADQDWLRELLPAQEHSIVVER